MQHWEPGFFFMSNWPHHWSDFNVFVVSGGYGMNFSWILGQSIPTKPTNIYNGWKTQEDEKYDFHELLTRNMAWPQDIMQFVFEPEPNTKNPRFRGVKSQTCFNYFFFPVPLDSFHWFVSNNRPTLNIRICANVPTFSSVVLDCKPFILGPLHASDALTGF